MRGPDDEFAEFLERAEPRLASYLHCAAGDAADVENGSQDACVVAYRNWRRAKKLDRLDA